jgi:hypothetical protein
MFETATVLLLRTILRRFDLRLTRWPSRPGDPQPLKRLPPNTTPVDVTPVGLGSRATNSSSTQEMSTERVGRATLGVAE